MLVHNANVSDRDARRQVTSPTDDVISFTDVTAAIFGKQ